MMRTLSRESGDSYGFTITAERFMYTMWRESRSDMS